MKQDSFPVKEVLVQSIRTSTSNIEWFQLSVDSNQAITLVLVLLRFESG